MTTKESCSPGLPCRNFRQLSWVEFPSNCCFLLWGRGYISFIFQSFSMTYEVLLCFKILYEGGCVFLCIHKLLNNKSHMWRSENSLWELSLPI